ncbi:hypothetical protein TSAR_011126 [Trichomalopsis sarcophagae]|uniref:Reverse transcriptase domain-containing protein n=1 Tax=Trichomalopsis sarcophagae TaxID=543379 RepID=A0A232FGY3_9HYME|nr:hypothetical protein TSAR_011126 [Trichomalopsis sarcophagae]
MPDTPQTTVYGKRERDSTSPNIVDDMRVRHATKLPRRKITLESVEKEFQKAKKETERTASVRTSTVVPNLDTARHRAQPQSQASTDSQTEQTAGQRAKNFFKNEWYLPRKTTKATEPGAPVTEPITTKNSFEALDSSMDYLSSTEETSNSKNNEQIDNKQENPAKAKQAQLTKKKDSKPPPIFCRQSTTKELISYLSAKLATDKFYIKENEKDNHAIHTTDELLVLKGVKGGFNQEEVLEELNRIKDETISITKVEPIKFSKKQEAETHFLVQITADSPTSNLTRVTKLLSQAVRWEPFKKTRVFQCKNCQRVGHSSANCALGYRCVKCLDKHEPGKCSRVKDDDNLQSAGCVNCGTLGHPANYRGCPFLKFAQETVNNSRQAAREVQQAKIKAIAKKFSFEHIVLPTKKTPQSLEATVIKLKCARGMNLFLISIYAPSQTNETFITELNQLFAATNLDNDNAHYVIAEDLNARHKDWGNKLKTIEFDSDHNAISIMINADIDSSNISQQVNTPYRYLFKKTKWPKFTRNMANNFTIDIPIEKQIDYHNSDTFFPSINRLYRPRRSSNIANIKVHETQENLLSKIGVDLGKTAKINDHYTLTNATDEGLQQGTVNAPDLFNIFNSDIINLYGLNSGNKTHSIAFADDLIAYVAGKSPVAIQNQLEEITNKVNKHYQQWNLKINPAKCETILFRRPMHSYNKSNRQGWKEFNIAIKDPTTQEEMTVPHSNVVKYLGVHLDHLIRMCRHPTMQLVKARNAFRANSRLFHSKHLDPRAKVICYMLLVRPILTYAAPVWFNTSASLMEKLRSFERTCLRTCLKMHRTAESNYKKFVSNKVIYDKANIPRIDNFIIQLTRDHFAKAKKITENELISGNSTINENYLTSCKTSGYLPAQAFTGLDNQGLIQNEDNLPIIYHVSRHQADKKICYSPHILIKNPEKIKYSKAIPQRDYKDTKRLNTDKYWWLSNNSTHLEELRQRTKKKRNHCRRAPVYQH